MYAKVLHDLDKLDGGMVDMIIIFSSLNYSLLIDTTTIRIYDLKLQAQQ